MKNQKYICLFSLYMIVTLYLQIVVEVGLYFHKPKVSLISNFMKHLERSHLTNTTTYSWEKVQHFM